MTDNDRKAESRSLKKLCFQAVRKHFDVVGTEAVLGLPTTLIKSLLPHLTVCQLDKLQPTLNQRGISTYSGWIGVLMDMSGPKWAKFLQTEEEAKHEVMKMLFLVVFYGFKNSYVRRNITNLNNSYFLTAAAKCCKNFSIVSGLHKRLHNLIAEERPLLNLFEEHMRSVIISHGMDLSTKKNQAAMYVFHRLVDHGLASKVVVHTDCPLLLAWLLHGRGSQYVDPQLMSLMQSMKSGCVSQEVSNEAEGASCSSGFRTMASENQDYQTMPSKRAKISFDCPEQSDKSEMSHFEVEPQALCQVFSPHVGPSAGACPVGQVTCLEVTRCTADSLRVLNSALPTFFSLRSLILHHRSLTFKISDVHDLTRALRKLSEDPRGSLTELNIGLLDRSQLMEVLLNASRVKSLLIEIRGVLNSRQMLSDVSELPLERLSMQVTEPETDLQLVTSILRRSPHLTALHLSGIRLPAGFFQSEFLSTVSESNPCLKNLYLEDMNLSDCLPQILILLEKCKLEELRFNDCRLLEKWNDKEKSLRQLVDALRKVPSLHTLSLAQNRLAKNVFVLAELFSGSTPRPVKHLDISSNFIQPSELLHFAHTLRTHPPPHQLTLDLRKNPGDRDHETWNSALQLLRPFCFLLVQDWISTNSMADHISNM